MGFSDDQEFKEPETPEEAQASFEHLFDELVDLLQMSVENLEQNPGTIPEGFESKIAQLEKDVAAFQQLHQPSSEEIPEEPPKLTRREEVSIERAEKLIEKGEELKKQLPQQRPTGPADIEDEKARRKHFRRLGRKKI